ncbi:hypothetical protein EPIR_1876 [Erwinia piriflorinigrans CFBP 5888]|uniref:Uncharacterized protein n=1 Tax=Erwinia piriflorinigrans CFBP 5888 TaxID=1161919 RepID=V5Z874_9GAMM|nr:hypothetical protein EPIR_1876 [Erwinia piriflorinigrans CFBP 5888]
MTQFDIHIYSISFEIINILDIINHLSYSSQVDNFYYT